MSLDGLVITEWVALGTLVCGVGGATWVCGITVLGLPKTFAQPKIYVCVHTCNRLQCRYGVLACDARRGWAAQAAGACPRICDGLRFPHCRYGLPKCLRGQRFAIFWMFGRD